jgi:HAMP domain-containing protein
MSHVDTPPARETTRDVEFVPARARTAASWLGLVFAVVLIGVGVVLVHDALVRLDVVAGSDWITSAADSTGTVRPGVLVAVIGLVLVVVALMLLVGAVTPRRRLGSALAAGNGQYVMPADIARLASAAAKRVDGVLDARSTATSSKVTVVAHITGDRESVDRVTQAVQASVSVLERPVKVRVRTHTTNAKDESR